MSERLGWATKLMRAAGDHDRAGNKAGRDRLLRAAADQYRQLGWTTAARLADTYQTMPLGTTAIG